MIEQVTAREAEDGVSFTYPDGSYTFVPSDVLSRSTLLSSCVQLDGSDTSMRLILPQEGYLQSWVQCIQLSTAAASHSFLQKTTAETLVKHCQAADFFGDERASRAMCKHISAWMFEGPIRRLQNPNTSDSVSLRPQQVLKNLSRDLALCVLQHTSASLEHMLQTLPEDLHHLVVQSFFPPTSSQRALTLSCDVHHYQTLASVLQAPQLSESFQTLHVIGLSYQSQSPACFLEALRQASMPLSHLSLHIQMDLQKSNTRLPPHEEQFWANLVSTNTLTSLEISAGVTVTRSLSAALEKAMQLTGLHSLCVWDTSCYHLPSSLSTLTLLTRLQLVCSDDLRQVLLTCLSSLQQLQILHLSPVIDQPSSPHNSTELAQARSLSPYVTSLSLSGPQLAGCAAYIDNLECLHTLCLSQVDKHHSSHVAGLLRLMNNLQDLSLETEVDCLPCLSQALQAAGTVSSCTKLVVSSPWLERQCTEVCQNLQPFTNLKQLRLSGAGVLCCSDGDSLAALAASLSQLTRLEHYHPDRESTVSISPFLQTVLVALTNLRHLALSVCALHSKDEDQVLVGSLVQLTNLRHLELDCPLCQGWSAVPATLTLLTHLHLQLRDSTFMQLALHQHELSTLTCLTSLRSLKVGGFSEVVMGGGTLRPVLKQMLQLQSLEISGLPVVASTTLVPAIGSLKALTHLVLWADYLTSVSNELRSLHNLRVLRLKCRFLGPGAAVLVVDLALSTLQNLTELHLDCHAWGREGVRALAKPLRCLSLLQKLSISFGKVKQPYGWPAPLSASLLVLPKLRTLDLGADFGSSLPRELVERFSLR